MSTVDMRLAKMRRQLGRAHEWRPIPPPLVWHGPQTELQHQQAEYQRRQRAWIQALYAPLLEYAQRSSILYYDAIAVTDPQPNANGVRFYGASTLSADVDLLDEEAP